MHRCLLADSWHAHPHRLGKYKSYADAHRPHLNGPTRSGMHPMCPTPQATARVLCLLLEEHQLPRALAGRPGGAAAAAIRPSPFIGSSGLSSTSLPMAFSLSAQRRTVEKFREGGYNVLLATHVRDDRFRM